MYELYWFGESICPFWVWLVLVIIIAQMDSSKQNFLRCWSVTYGATAAKDINACPNALNIASEMNITLML